MNSEKKEVLLILTLKYENILMEVVREFFQQKLERKEKRKKNSKRKCFLVLLSLYREEAERTIMFIVYNFCHLKRAA